MTSLKNLILKSDPEIVIRIQNTLILQRSAPLIL